MSTPKTTPEPGTKPKFLVVEDKLIAQTSNGELKLPLKVKTKVFREIKELPDELDQLFALLDGIGDTETAAALDELDIFETQDVVEKFFEEFQTKAKARVGESSRSSGS
jgi:hypothetical protein